MSPRGVVLESHRPRVPGGVDGVQEAPEIEIARSRSAAPRAVGDVHVPDRPGQPGRLDGGVALDAQHVVGVEQDTRAHVVRQPLRRLGRGRQVPGCVVGVQRLDHDGDPARRRLGHELAEHPGRLLGGGARGDAVGDAPDQRMKAAGADAGREVHAVEERAPGALLARGVAELPALAGGEVAAVGVDERDAQAVVGHPGRQGVAVLGGRGPVRLHPAEPGRACQRRPRGVRLLRVEHRDVRRPGEHFDGCATLQATALHWAGRSPRRGGREAEGTRLLSE